MKADMILQYCAVGFFMLFVLAGLFGFVYQCHEVSIMDTCQLDESSPFYVLGEVAFLAMAFSSFSFVGTRAYLFLRDRA